jgi:hypothetical protein
MSLKMKTSRIRMDRLPSNSKPTSAMLPPLNPATFLNQGPLARDLFMVEIYRVSNPARRPPSVPNNCCLPVAFMLPIPDGQVHWELMKLICL